MAVFDPLISLLKGSAGDAFQYLRSQAASGVSLTQALKNFRATGGSIRTDTAATLYRTLLNKADVSDYLKLIGEDAPLPLAAHTLGPVLFSNGAQFQYLVGTNSTNPLIPEAIYVNSIEPLSANDIYAKATQAFSYAQGSGMSADDLGDVTFTIDDARYAPGSSTDIQLGGSQDAYFGA